MLVNYRYDPATIERNHEAYVNSGGGHLLVGGEGAAAGQGGGADAGRRQPRPGGVRWRNVQPPENIARSARCHQERGSASGGYGLTGTANVFGTDGPFTGTLGALTREYKALGGKDTPSELEGYYEAAFAQENAALCLSGGGIRSAAFALGVVQALARMGLLTRFQYLSTVSGGGYLGAWLSRWILDQRRQGRTLEQAATHVQEELARSGEEPRQWRGCARTPTT